MSKGIRFPAIHIAESVRQRILATFEELGGYVPGVEAGMPGAVPQLRQPDVPSTSLAGSLALDSAVMPGPQGPGPGMGAGPGPGAGPAASQAALAGVLTGGNLVDTLGAA